MENTNDKQAVKVECKECNGTGSAGFGERCSDCNGKGYDWEPVEDWLDARQDRPATTQVPVTTYLAPDGETRWPAYSHEQREEYASARAEEARREGYEAGRLYEQEIITQETEEANARMEAEMFGCRVPPAGWRCTRAAGHAGPCAAQPVGEAAAQADDWQAKHAAAFQRGIERAAPTAQPTPEELAKAKWNAEADQYNQWSELGQDEKDELIAAQPTPQARKCQLRLCLRADEHATGCTTYDPARYPETRMVAQPTPPDDELRNALAALLKRYGDLAGSGDAGNWDWEAEEVVVAARAALRHPPVTNGAEARRQAFAEVGEKLRANVRPDELAKFVDAEILKPRAAQPTQAGAEPAAAATMPKPWQERMAEKYGEKWRSQPNFGFFMQQEIDALRARLASAGAGEASKSHGAPEGTEQQSRTATAANAAGLARLVALASEEYGDAAASVQHGASKADVPEWAQLVVMLFADRAPAADAAGQGDDDLGNALVLFDMGLGFALCHREFGATRDAVKKLQHDFKEIRTLIGRTPARQDSAAADKGE